jgi:hypothetical protein
MIHKNKSYITWTYHESWIHDILSQQSMAHKASTYKIIYGSDWKYNLRHGVTLSELLSLHTTDKE